MSEYQYYEFVAVDRPLTLQQQAELRRYSTRATITASCFSNEYHWGSFKGDTTAWMQQYFDAHIHSANWADCRLLLRVPANALDLSMLEACQPCDNSAWQDDQDAFSYSRHQDNYLLTWHFSDDSGENERFWNEDDGPDWMVRLLPLRTELLRGDARPLYLGWLARLSAGQLDDDAVEPPVPAGLAELTPAQQALTRFLELDPDQLVVAASASPVLESVSDADYDSWLSAQPAHVLQASVRLLLEGRAPEAERSVRRHFLAWQAAQHPEQAPAPRRQVAEIRRLAQRISLQRQQAERQAAAEAHARQQAEHAIRLTALAAESARVWAEIDAQLSRGVASGYDQALQLTLTLAEAMQHVDRRAEFQRELDMLLTVHGKRRAWMTRLAKTTLLAR